MLSAFVAAPCLRRPAAVHRAANRCALRAMSAPARSAAATPPAGDPLVQYVVVRTDLDWPLGSLMAQGIHAALRATHPADDAHTAAYVSPGAAQQMTTVVLAAKNVDVLHKTAEKLANAGVRYCLWQEQPENIPTALASRPAPRATLKPLFQGLRLLR